MRMTILAITGALVACAAAPASAATNAGSWTPTYNTCEALAMNRGITVSERRSSEIGQSAYRQFMVSCLAGKVEGKPIVTARLAPAEQIPGKWARGSPWTSVSVGIGLDPRDIKTGWFTTGIRLRATW